MARDVSRPTGQMPRDTPAILNVLKQCAADKTTITYTDLVKGTSIQRQNVGEQLSYIHEQVCLPYGRPWLCVLAVSKKTGCPSPGIARATGVSFQGADGARLWCEKVREVYTYDWSDVDLEVE